ncbi:hypothetical protein OG982_06210 [Streptomyces sp. NBC_01551]|uniref:hypothetical protein n=1 Tax=Streptomyces sp. NBC_01551 TaxID=2975876 RepID=UPI00224D19E6|nr:hypothetical protein [Streptomyces sp. NBC_01551]MCX4525287.1 hypothetical protein [Streptomyces sp. NBC_01551]
MTTPDMRAQYRDMDSADVLWAVQSLAAVHAAEGGRAAELAAAAGILQYRYSFPLHQGAAGPRPDSGIPSVDLMRRVSYEGNGFLAVAAGEVRAAMGGRPLSTVNLCSFPDPLPAADAVEVLLYNPLAGVAALVGRFARGEDITDALRDVEARAVQNLPPYQEW